MLTLDVDMAAPGLERIIPEGAMLDVIAQGIQFGEGPVWDDKKNCLFFVDITGDTIWKWTPGIGSEIVMRPSTKADGMTLDREGRVLVAGWGSRTVWRLEPDGSTTTLASHWQGKRLNTPNDIVVKSDGWIYFTDPSGACFNVGMGGPDVQRYLDFHGVFRVSTDGRQLDLLIDDFVYPNGLCFSPDESLLYVNDTRLNNIRVFDVRPDGSVTNGRLFFTCVGDEPGLADGMRCDVEGNVYVTGPTGMQVVSPEGQLLGRIHIPTHVTNMGFGDPDWKGLYVTTLGFVYRIRMGIPGIPPATKVG